MNANWHRSVYRRKIKNTMNKDEWYKLKIACLKRDKYSCQRCEKHNAQGRGMTAHHIIPRSEEGPDDLSNLITLCDPCHDYVEINELRTWADIVGSYETKIDLSNEVTEDKTDEGYHFKRPDWHKYVYGGHKRN